MPDTESARPRIESSFTDAEHKLINQALDNYQESAKREAESLETLKPNDYTGLAYAYAAEADDRQAIHDQRAILLDTPEAFIEHHQARGLPDSLIQALTTPGRYVLALSDGLIIQFTSASYLPQSASWVRLVIEPGFDRYPSNRIGRATDLDIRLDSIVWCAAQPADHLE